MDGEFLDELACYMRAEVRARELEIERLKQGA